MRDNAHVKLKSGPSSSDDVLVYQLIAEPDRAQFWLNWKLPIAAVYSLLLAAECGGRAVVRLMRQAALLERRPGRDTFPRSMP